jgi:hypothetical protein
MEDERDDAVEVPKIGCLVLLVPIIAILLTFVAYAVLIGSGIRGRPADGAVTQIHLRGCVDAQEVVAQRAQAMGYDDAILAAAPGGFSITFRMPTDSQVSETLPRTLARTGMLEIRADEKGAVLGDNALLESATTRLDLTMAPSTYVTLTKAGIQKIVAHQEANPEGTISFWVDGARLGSQQNARPVTEGSVDLWPASDDQRMQIRRAAAHAIVLDSGPLPCALTIASVQPL